MSTIIMSTQMMMLCSLLFLPVIGLAMAYTIDFFFPVGEEGERHWRFDK